MLQDEDSQVEAQLLMSVPVQIVSPQANKPCIGFVQDSVIGSWLLTRDDTVVPRSLAFALIASIRHTRQDLPSKDHYTGKEIFSVLLPPELHYRNKRTGVVIEHGFLVSGMLCKVTLGATSGGIVHSMYHSFGPTRTANFLSDTQRLVNRWLLHRGFSIKLSDCEPLDTTRDEVALAVRLAQQKVTKIMQTTQPLSAKHPNILTSQRIEETLSEIANRVLTNVGKVVHASLNEKTNSLYQAVLCASKGNLINVAQLVGCIGQTSVEGRRILICDPQEQFGQGDTLGKCGFVSSSYFSGLSHTEFFFHTMAGREGLIDTAVKTANTGYLQRRLMKAMETLTVAYDRTVRNANQNILQFQYGADDFDATYVLRQTLPCLTTSLSELENNFEPGGEWQMFKDVLLGFRERKWRFLLSESDTFVYCPGSVEDIYMMFQARSKMYKLAESDCLSSAECLARVNKLCEGCCVAPWSYRACYAVLLRWNLRYEAVRTFPTHVFDDMLAEITRRTHYALVAPGEAVGALSAQSISEPLTQLTLNTCGT